MDSRHEAAFKLDALAIQYPQQIGNVYKQFGYNGAVNVNTLSAMVIKHKEPFLEAVYKAIRPPFFAYDGQDSGQEKTGFKSWLDKASKLLFGVNEIVNNDEETPKKTSSKKDFFGVPYWAIALIVLVIVIVIVMVTND